LVSHGKKSYSLRYLSLSGLPTGTTITGIFGDPEARIIRLTRRGIKQFVESAGRFIGPFTTGRYGEFEIFHAAIPGFSRSWRSAGWIGGRAGK
jgi:hypothetical protein